VGKLVALVGGLVLTFVAFFALSVRMAVLARQVEVPTLVGATVDEATAALGEVELALRIDDNPRPHDTIEAGRIAQQDPSAGATSRQQRSVRVWISSGPRTTVVPVLTGQSERAAQVRLQQDGVAVSSVSEFRSADYPTDAVVSQNPPPASSAPEVSLLINRGELAATYVMPDIIGLEGERVADALRQQGFRVSIVGAQPYPGVPPGTVVRQQPPSGFRVGATDAISLEVSQ
jgi:serine/threonine-protein kinase